METSRYGDWAGDWALIVVRDQGIGIDGAATETVFTGYRTTAARRTAPGSGLGLQLSRRYVEAQGGELWVTGMPGSGCAFYIRLPLAHSMRSGPPVPTGRASGSACRRRGERGEPPAPVAARGRGVEPGGRTPVAMSEQALRLAAHRGRYPIRGALARYERTLVPLICDEKHPGRHEGST